MSDRAAIRRRRSKEIDDRLTALTGAGMDVLARDSGRTLARLLIAFRNGRPMLPLFAQQRETLAAAGRHAMVAAHLAGSFAVLVDAEASIRKSLSEPYAGAVEAAKKKANLTAEQLRALERVYGPAASRIANELTEAVEARMRRAIQEIVEQNLHVDAGVQALTRAYAAAGVAPRKRHQLEATVRTQVQLAYSAGAVAMSRRPEIDEILWGWEYATVGDDRVRPNHEALDGVRLPKSDPQWSRIMPPNGYNCRCTALALYRDDVGDGGGSFDVVPVPDTASIDGKEVKSGADPGWNFNPGDLFAHIDTMTDTQLAAVAKATA